MRKIKIPALFRTVITVFLVVLIAALSLLMYRTWKFPGTVVEKVPLYSYSLMADVDYKVAYRNNILTGAATVGAGDTYITEYLSNILTTLNYEFKGERAAEIQGSYDVSATLVGFRKEQDKVITIWTKDYQLVPNTPFQATDSTLQLTRDLSLSLRSYNDFVERFSKETKISCETNLVVRWNVNLEAKTDKGVIRETALPTLIIPVNKSYFNISGEPKVEKKAALEDSVTRTLPVNYKLLYLLGAGLAVAFVVLIFIIFFTQGVRITDPVARKMKEILKKHGERLVTLSSDTVLSGSTYPVKSLEDLIKIADELSKPVLYQAEEAENILPVFYVLDEPRIYSYQLEPGLDTKPPKKEPAGPVVPGPGVEQGKEA